jgi:hypothetical protein
LDDSALNAWLSYRLHDEWVFAGECLSELDQVSVAQGADIEHEARTLVDIITRSHILPYKIQAEMNEFSVTWGERPDTKEVAVDWVADSVQSIGNSFKSMYSNLSKKF